MGLLAIVGLAYVRFLRIDGHCLVCRRRYLCIVCVSCSAAIPAVLVYKGRQGLSGMEKMFIKVALFGRQGGGDGMWCARKTNGKVFVELLGIDGGQEVPRALAKDR